MSSETKWNREIFSDTNEDFDPTMTENFQVDNMIYKIKKIKKQRQHRKKYEPIQSLDETTTPSIPLINLHEPFENVREREGLTNFDLCKDYDGVERECQPQDNAEAEKSESFSPNIKDFFGNIDRFNYNKAKYLAQVLSKNTQTESDVLILKRYIAIFEVVLISYFFAYNLFFVIFYKNEFGISIHETMSKIDGSWIKNQSVTNPLFVPIDWVFGYAIKFCELLQTLLFRFIPMISYVLNPAACFIVLFLAIIYISLYFVSGIKDFFLSIAEGDFTNPWVLGFFCILIFNIVTCAFDVFNVNTFTYSMSWIRNFVLFLPWSILSTIVQFIIIMIVSVPVGCILCALTFVYFSTYIIWHLLYTGEWSRFFFIFEKIRSFIEKGDKQETSGELSFLQKIKYVVNIVSDFLYNYILYIVYLFVIVFALIDYLHHIQSSNLKMSLGAISVSLIIFFVSLCIVGFIRSKDMDRTLPEESIIEKGESFFYQSLHWLPSFIVDKIPDALKNPDTGI